MHATWVEVFDRANDDAVVRFVAHHFHLIFFPAQNRLFNQQFVGRRGIETALTDFQKLFFVVSNTAARATHGERWTYQSWKTYFGLSGQRFFHGVTHVRLWAMQTDFFHRQFKAATVFGFVDGVFSGTNQFHIVFFQHAIAGQIQGTVQCGLTTHGRQNRIWALFGNDLLNRLPTNRLDVSHIGHFRVGHDGGWIGVHQHHFIAFFTQSFTSLRARIVKLTRLTDDNRPCAYDQNGF